MIEPGQPVHHWLLTYTLAPDYLARREAFRTEHLALAAAAAGRGELLLGGAVYDGEGQPPEEALLLFTDAAAAEAFARTDPYVLEGLVIQGSVREWASVAGAWTL